MTSRTPRRGGLAAAIDSYGGIGPMAERFGISFQAVAQWTDIPADRCVEIHRDTGIPLPVLRPDLYPSDLVNCGSKRRAKPAREAAA